MISKKQFASLTDFEEANQKSLAAHCAAVETSASRMIAEDLLKFKFELLDPLSQKLQTLESLFQRPSLENRDENVSRVSSTYF